MTRVRASPTTNVQSPCFCTLPPDVAMADENSVQATKVEEEAPAVVAAGSAEGAEPAAKPWRMETPPEFLRSPDEVRHELAQFSVYLSERTRHHLGYVPAALVVV